MCKGPNFSGCRGCRFFSAVNGHERTCDYIIHTGHRRPCPIGPGCSVKEPRNKVPTVCAGDVVRGGFRSSQTEKDTLRRMSLKRWTAGT